MIEYIDEYLNILTILEYIDSIGDANKNGSFLVKFSQLKKIINIILNDINC